MSDLYISWSEYHQKIETLAAKIYDSGWEFDQIVCLAKGGLRVGDILSRLYRKPLAIISTSAYRGGSHTRDKIIISQHLSMTTETLGRKILLADDLVDSGVSLQETVKWLIGNHNIEPDLMRTAVIWYKSCSDIKPDYYVDYLADNPWIHQPFERYEQISLADLLFSVER